MTLQDPADLREEDAPPEVVIGDDRDDDEKAIDSRFQKRINKETRRRYNAERRAKGLEDELTQTRAALAEARKSTIDYAAYAIDGELDKAQRDAKAAFEAGDADAHVAANAKLADASARKRDIENRKAAAPAAPQQPAPPSEAVRDWISANPWFDEDPTMRSAALAIHEDLLRRGVQPETKRYFDAIDQRMRAAFPDLAEEDDDLPADLDDDPPPPPPRRAARPGAAVTPANRAPPVTQARQNVVRLTQDEADIARSMNMSPAQYAVEKAKLQKAGKIR